MHYSLSKVCHQTNQSCVPLVRNLCESSGARSHQNLTNAVFEALDSIIIDSDKGLSCDFLGALVLELPDTVLLREFLLSSPAFGQNSDFEATHVEEHIWVVFGVY